jgi:hypothetical protein
VARNPTFGAIVITNKQERAGVVCLARYEAPSASKVIFHAVFDPRFAVICNLDTREGVQVVATQNNPRSVATLLSLAAGKKR